MKPLNPPSNFFLEPGDRFEVLDAYTPLKKTDLIRDLFERPMNSESGGWDLTWKPKDWKGTMWHLVEYEFRAWIGKTYYDYMMFQRPRQDNVEHEIIRLLP